ncbi:DUF6422 family protein [Streptomyces tropicalis]|uniref:Uncharacterized protein n=1 Tax=Streptomyces tropicalis TaxID=3034234 RepID=A0ABT6AD02_9ACTN|nr:DUF6422 family protein [Streptomyces tropicalis]MDF3302524.1 hypothetical protein [Streptomyces tropicalis]
MQNRKQRTSEQSKALQEAALLIINARREAVARVLQSEAELLPEERDWFEGPCMGQLHPPPTPHPCGCSVYKGNGRERCLTRWTDFLGPDAGDGSPHVLCQHLPEEHAAI